jgi:hypothetical protein
MGYGGFAKTENKLDVIKLILETDIKNGLSHNKEIKLSLQTLDDEILKNIDRKNIPFEKQLAVFELIAKNTKLPLYVEIIMGLPGMTLDKFHYELTVFGSHGLSLQWFEWILLPEAPSYGYEYRRKWSITTTNKTNGWSHPESHAQHEIVVGTSTYSTSDYLEMLLSASLYNLFVQGGYLKDTIDWIRSNYNIGHGDIIRSIYRSFFMKDLHCKKEREKVLGRWEEILADPKQDCTFDIMDNKVYGGYYFVSLVFLKCQTFRKRLEEYIVQTYKVPLGVYHGEKNLYITRANIGKHYRQGLSTIRFNKTKHNELASLISMYKLFLDTGNIMRGNKKLLGIFQ